MYWLACKISRHTISGAQCSITDAQAGLQPAWTKLWLQRQTCSAALDTAQINPINCVESAGCGACHDGKSSRPFSRPMSHLQMVLHMPPQPEAAEIRVSPGRQAAWKDLRAETCCNASLHHPRLQSPFMSCHVSQQRAWSVSSQTLTPT